MRSRRSSPRSRTSFSHHGTVITATPTSVASTASRANWICPSCRLPKRKTAIPPATNTAPARPPQRRPPGQPGAGAFGPAAALGLVGLAPHDGRADRGDAERADDPSDERVARSAARDPRPRCPARRAPPPAGARSGHHPGDVGCLLPHEDPQQAVCSTPAPRTDPRARRTRPAPTAPARRGAEATPPATPATNRPLRRRTSFGVPRGPLVTSSIVTPGGPGDIGGRSGDSRGRP